MKEEELGIKLWNVTGSKIKKRKFMLCLCAASQAVSASRISDDESNSSINFNPLSVV
jgi:hypothetical protein